jgi:hypothetical protein
MGRERGIVAILLVDEEPGMISAMAVGDEHQATGLLPRRTLELAKDVCDFLFFSRVGYPRYR